MPGYCIKALLLPLRPGPGIRSWKTCKKRGKLQDGRGVFWQFGVSEAALENKLYRIQSDKHSSAYGFSVLASNAKYRVEVDIC